MSVLITVIVPCYNQGEFLEECLISVFSQTYTHWECIIVNDGSTDQTASIARKWCKIDLRFKYIEQVNKGLSSARNIGLKNASGELIQFLDSDDLISKLKFEKQIQCFNDGIDIVICDYLPFDTLTRTMIKTRYLNPFPDVCYYLQDIILKWENELSIPVHCILFKKSLLNQKQLVLFDELLQNHEDWVFWSKIFYYSNGIFNLKYPFAKYRIHKESMSNNKIKMHQGFILAAKANLHFFQEVKDLKMQKLCRLKLDSLIRLNEENKTNKLNCLKDKFYAKFLKIFKNLKKLFNVEN